MGNNYLRSLFALGFQAFLIMVCVGIYGIATNVGENYTIPTTATGDLVLTAVWALETDDTISWLALPLLLDVSPPMGIVYH